MYFLFLFHNVKIQILSQFSNYCSISGYDAQRFGAWRSKGMVSTYSPQHFTPKINFFAFSFSFYSKALIAAKRLLCVVLILCLLNSIFKFYVTNFIAINVEFYFFKFDSFRKHEFLKFSKYSFFFFQSKS